EGRVDRYTTADGLSSNSIIQIFQDREGNVWAGTGRGLDKFTRPAVPSITSKQGLSVDYINSVLSDRQGVLWAGTRSGLYRLIDGHWIKSTLKLPDDLITSLFETSQGHVVVATGVDKGIVQLDGTKVSPLGLVDGDVFGVAEDSHGDVWFASHELGLLHFGDQGRLLERFDRKMLLARLNVAVAFDPTRNGFWLTSSIGEIGLFKDGA